MVPAIKLSNALNALPISNDCAGEATPEAIAHIIAIESGARCAFVVKKNSAFHGARWGFSSSASTGCAPFSARS